MQNIFPGIIGKLFYQVFLFAGIFTFTFVRLAHAQEQNIRFDHLSSDNGLSQNSVLCILQDSRGFMWFGTYDGLNRYDGYEFKIFKSESGNPNSLSSNSVESIYEDRSGVLWIGTEGGLDQYDQEKECFIHFRNNPNDTNSLSSNRIEWISEDTSGILWIGTFGGGLNQLDKERNRFIRYQYNPADPYSISSNIISCVCIDRSGNPWIATDGGIDRFDRQKNRFIHFQNDSKNPHSLSRNNAYRVFEDKSGVLWIGLWGGGLDRFDRDKEQFIHYRTHSDDPHSLSNDVIRSIYEDRAGRLWIGTWGGGLDRLDRKSNCFIHYRTNPNDPSSLSNNSLLSIYEDRSGILWIGNDFAGINKYDRGKIKFVHYKKESNTSHGLSVNTIYSMYETVDKNKKSLWIGTQGGGLNKFEREKNQFTHYRSDPHHPRSLSDDNVRAILEDRAGALWIGTTSGGLNQFDRIKETFIHYISDPNNRYSLSSSSIFTICEDRLGYIWVGTYGGGLDKFNQKTKKFTRYLADPRNPNSLNDNYIWSIIEDRAGVLWIGTENGGLNQFDREKNRFIHYKADPDKPNNLSSNKILCIHEDGSGMLWLGTTNGLNKFDRINNRFFRYLEADGLPSNTIQSILEDGQGHLWLGTQKGLSKFDPRTNRFKNFKVSDGLQSNEFSVNACYKGQNGEMFFGGINGFNAFFPDSIKENMYIPTIVITDFQIFNKSIPVGKEIDGHVILEKSITKTNEINLSYKENYFSFKFSSFNFTAPEGNRFAYMMDGFDKGWIYTDASKRFASYTNLSGGEYVFRVKGTNSDGLWNEAGTSIRVIIVPPFWKTMWFYALCVLVSISTVVGVYRYRIYRVRVNERNLQKKVAERTQELAREVDEHQKTEEALQRERNLFRILIDHLPDAIYVKDILGRKTIANMEHVRLLGKKSEAEVLGKSDYDFYPADVAAKYFAIDQSIIQTGQPVLDKEERVQDKNGMERWVLTSKLPLRNEQDGTIGIVGVDRDITARRRAEEKIAEQAHLLDIALDPIILRDMNGTLIFWNKAAELLYGWTFEEAKSLDAQQFITEEDRSLYDWGRRKFIETGECEIELHEKSRNGRIITTNSRWSLVRDENGKPYARLIIVRDMTEQRNLEAHFRRVQRMESLGTLASGMAHDLKNLLVPVKLAAELLQRKHEDQKSKSMLTSIGLSAEHSINLVQQVLAFVRGVEGQHVPLKAADLLRQVLSAIQETLPPNIEVESNIPDDPTIVLGDETQLRQVLNNLINNAKDAMPKGGHLTVALACERVDKAMAEAVPNAIEGSFVVWTIADTGVGIPAEHIEKIFEPFYTTKEITKGTGLGLSIVAGNIKGHKGFITVESVVGKGTTFHVYLPVAQGVQPASAP